MFTKTREQQKGGGVAIYVNSQISSRQVSEITVPDELECVWVLLQPKKLPRDFSVIVVCGVYIPFESPHQDALREHLLTSMDLLHTKYPEIGFVIMGDFNRMHINDILYNCNLRQLIKFPTRGQATLVLTNLIAHYEDPSPLSALGENDHICIKWMETIRLQL